MKSRTAFFLAYYAYWLCFFILAKIVFLLYHLTQTKRLNFSDIAGIISHGFLLDMSAAGYLVLFPFVILILTVYNGFKIPSLIINGYTLLILISVLVLTMADLEIYKYWGTRIDNTAMRFIGPPREMLASTSWSMIILFSLALLIFTISLFLLYNKLAGKLLSGSENPRWKGLIVFAVIAPFLFIAIRGGTGIAPISVSRVYFHPDPYPNHAAINVLWNIGHSFLEKKDHPNPFLFADKPETDRYLEKLYAADTTVFPALLLKTNRPNVILVILESFTAKLIEPLGGLKGVTPNMNRLSGESIFFTNLFANDSRTDKSIVSILSGYPALGKISIIKFPDKTQKLGIISRDLAENGYHTSFYYGGDVDFGNIRSYLVNGHFKQIVEMADFDKSIQTGRWGVHDQYTFQLLYDECKVSDTPFFKVLLTLSSHEPFDTPVKPKFGNKTIDEKISSSAFYTDSCLGDFIQKAKTAPWWDNTVIILLADHGTKFPGNSIVYYPEKYKIPMIWTGGAIKSDTLIRGYLSQSDLAKTLLNQLDINTSAYPLSRDIFNSQMQFAFYEFNNGFGMMSDSGSFVYDNDLNQIILNHGIVSDDFIRSGRIIQQEVYDVFLRN